MYADSPFARPVSSFRRPAPIINIDPDTDTDKTVCFRSEWTPYIVGALRQLLLQTTWATDDPDVLNLMQARAQLLIALFMEGCHDTPPIDGVEFDGEEIMGSLCEALRFHEGKLQAKCCGEWVNIDGQPGQGLTGPGQPGGGTNTPPAGGCATYNAAFVGSSQWLLPALVNAGDVLTFSNAKGAAPDGGISGLWYCPNGQTFFAGQCVGVPGVKAGDVASAIEHMRLVALINGVYYPANAGTITIPGGVVDAQVVIQANDSSISDNSGSYTLTIEMCNNQAVSWSHPVNLRTSPAGFEPTTDGGAWDAGIGIHTTNVIQSPNNGQQMVEILDFGRTISFDSVDFTFDTVLGSHGGTRYQLAQWKDSGGTWHTFADHTPPTTGTNQHLASTGGFDANALLLVGVMDAVATGTDTDGSWNVNTMTVTGHGFDPFV